MMLREVEQELTIPFGSKMQELSRKAGIVNVDLKVKQNISTKMKKYPKNDLERRDIQPKDFCLATTQPGSAIVANQMFKTKLCIDNQTKGCTRGDRCPYAHSVSEMRNLPDLRKTKMCALVLSGKRCKNRSCSFAHSEDELRYTCGFAEFKTQICRFAEEHGGRGCLYGTRCPYAHSPLEIRPLETPTVAPTEILVEQKKTNSSKSKGGSDNPKKSFIKENDHLDVSEDSTMLNSLYKEMNYGWRPQSKPEATDTKFGASHGQRSRAAENKCSPTSEQNKNFFSYPCIHTMQTEGNGVSTSKFPIKLSSGKRTTTNILPKTEERSSRAKAFPSGKDGVFPYISEDHFPETRYSSQENFLASIFSMPRCSSEQSRARSVYLPEECNFVRDGRSMKTESVTDSTLWEDKSLEDQVLVDVPPGLLPIYGNENDIPNVGSLANEVDIESQLESFAAAMKKFESCDRISLLQLQQEFISELQRRENVICRDSSTATERLEDIISLEKISTGPE